MNSNPETAQICRQYFRIPLFSAVVFVETSKDQQIWTVFISRMTLPWFAGWAEYRSQISNYAEKAAVPLFFSGCGSYNFN